MEQIFRSYAVLISARGEDGDQLITFNSELLSADELPFPLSRIEFQLGAQYQYLRQRQPDNWATIAIDFTKPPILDLKNPSGSPTPNDSVIKIQGRDRVWVAGILGQVLSVFQQNKVQSGWLHSSHIYDALLFLVGLPVALPVAAEIAGSFAEAQIGGSSWLGLATFIFVFLVVLLMFRLSFSFMRWLLPYVEFSRAPGPVNRRLRVLLATFILGALASIVGTVILSVIVGLT